MDFSPYDWLVFVLGGRTLLVGSIAIVVGLLLVGLYLAFLFLPGVRSNVMLDCPHCGEQTPANRSECRHCDKSFRDPVE